jgi:hypothetical protein
MKNTALLVLSAVALSACQDVPTRTLAPEAPMFAAASSPAITTTYNEIVPLDQYIFVACANGGAGELVQLSGDLHVLITSTINGNTIRVNSHFQPQGGTGVGLTTGDTYQATGVTQDQSNGNLLNGQFEASFVNNFRIIGRGPGNNFLSHENFHVTVNAAGEISTTHDNVSFDCK